jgi:pimeloyl-ACP methyl ester carboxylesterase
MVNKAGRMIGEPVANIAVASKIQRVNYQHLLLIHDRKDKVIPFEFSATVHQAAPQSELMEFEKIGHYRMLWNDEVVEAISARFPEKVITGSRLTHA